MSADHTDYPADTIDTAKRVWAELLTVRHPASDREAWLDVESIAEALLAERQSRNALVEQERARCLRIANGWLIAWGNRGDELKFTTPQQWANDAVTDIADLIASGADPFPVAKVGAQ